MSADPTWHGRKGGGCQGSAGGGRTLGTSARCAEGFPQQEDPPGRARCRDESSGRPAGAPGAVAVCPGACRHARGARSRAGHRHAADAERVGGADALRCPVGDGCWGSGGHAGRRDPPAAGAPAARAGRRRALRPRPGGPNRLPHARGTRDVPPGGPGQPPDAGRRGFSAGVDDRVGGRPPLPRAGERVRAARGARGRRERRDGGADGGACGRCGLRGAAAPALGGPRGRAPGGEC